ncbi:MAG: hypothetical protein MUC65_01225 [Pontiellaceae bacterium]|jgi:hypothetical protein|nr:hypothetical protein [Pontiellaceae bacterium]
MSKKFLWLLSFIFLCMGNNLFSEPDSPKLNSGLAGGGDLSVPGTVPVSKLDLLKDVLDEAKYPRMHFYRQGCLFSQTGRVLTVSCEAQPGANAESYISIGKLCEDAVIEMDLLSQTHNTFTASAILSLHQNKDNRMLFVQRDVDSDKKSLYFEVIKGGESVLRKIVLKEGVAVPDTLRMRFTGATICFSLIKEGQCTVLCSVNVGSYFDLNSPAVRNSFLVCAGAKLQDGESVSLTRFEQCRVDSRVSERGEKSVKSPENRAGSSPVAAGGAALPVSNAVLVSRLDLSQEALDGLMYPQIHLYRQACAFSQDGQVLTLSNQAEPGITAESYISIGKLCEDAVIQVQLLSQTHNTFTASGILSLHQSKDNRILFVQRDIDANSKALFFEVVKDGESVLYKILIKEGVAVPDTLRMSLAGSTIKFSLIKGGQCLVMRSVDVGSYFDLKNTAVRNSFTVCAGAKLRGGESISLTGFEQYRIGKTKSARGGEGMNSLSNKAVLFPVVGLVFAGVVVFLIRLRISKKKQQQQNSDESKPKNLEF